MRPYIILTLLLILLMAGFGVWYLQSPLATQDQLAPLPQAEPWAQRDAAPKSPAQSSGESATGQNAGSTGEAQAHPPAEPVVLDLSLPESFLDGEHTRIREPEREQLLPEFFNGEKQAKPRSVNGRLMLEESEEGKTVVDGVEINFSRPLR